MRKISLYIAVSLDGYIADNKGGVNWLKGQDENDNTNKSYSEFIEKIDTIIMGWNTYHQFVTELSPDFWPYENQITYVMTHREEASSEKIRFINEDLNEFVIKLKKEKGKNIWICGGANVVQQLMDEDLIDVCNVTIIPTILGSGVRLFKKGKNEIKLSLVKAKTYNGMIDAVYTRR